MKKQRRYSNYRFKSIGTFVTDNLILLKQYPNESKICIETAQGKLPNGQLIPSPPYLLRITLPIAMPQEQKIKILREADNLVKSIPKELIGSNEPILGHIAKIKTPTHLYVKTYGDIKDPSGKAALKKDYHAMKIWVKKRYRELSRNASRAKYYARYDTIAKELVGRRFGKVVITNELSTERRLLEILKSMDFSGKPSKANDTKLEEIKKILLD